jgi:hypothetical protein
MPSVDNAHSVPFDKGLDFVSQLRRNSLNPSSLPRYIPFAFPKLRVRVSVQAGPYYGCSLTTADSRELFYPLWDAPRRDVWAHDDDQIRALFPLERFTRFEIAIIDSSETSRAPGGWLAPADVGKEKHIQTFSRSG